MNASKVLTWVIIGIAVLFGIWLLEIVFGVAIGVIGLFLSLVGGLLSLVFSKSGMTLIAILLAVYIIKNKGEQRRYHY